MPHRLAALRPYTTQIAIAILLLACALFGFSLDRYQGFYVDDSFFSYAALNNAQGHAFSYPVSSAAPYADQIWSFHGPVLPNLYFLLFKAFGFSIRLIRLPDFLGGWLAAIACVIFLHRRGYKYAGLILTILWLGDRSIMEIMYGRMEGLALLCLVLSLFALSRAIRTRSAGAALLCGFISGFCPLVHPLALYFTALTAVAIWYFVDLRALARFVLGCLLNAPILLVLWRFKVRESWAQFRWHMGTHTVNGSGLSGFLKLMQVLHWSRFWVAATLVIVLISVAYAVILVRRFGRTLPAMQLDLVLLALYGAAGLVLLFKSSMFPYYLVYLSIWPLLFLSIVAEVYRKPLTPWLFVLAIFWIPSAFWNLVRLRESVLEHSQLSRNYLLAEIHHDVPGGARLATTPELYSVPIEGGYQGVLTYWFPEHQEVCPQCYLLVEAEEFKKPEYIAADNLAHRTVLYRGPAFPKAHANEYPVVLLSPLHP